MRKKILAFSRENYQVVSTKLVQVAKDKICHPVSYIRMHQFQNWLLNTIETVEQCDAKALAANLTVALSSHQGRFEQILNSEYPDDRVPSFFTQALWNTTVRVLWIKQFVAYIIKPLQEKLVPRPPEDIEYCSVGTMLNDNPWLSSDKVSVPTPVSKASDFDINILISEVSDAEKKDMMTILNFFEAIMQTYFSIDMEVQSFTVSDPDVLTKNVDLKSPSCQFLFSITHNYVHLAGATHYKRLLQQLPAAFNVSEAALSGFCFEQLSRRNMKGSPEQSIDQIIKDPNAYRHHYLTVEAARFYRSGSQRRSVVEIINRIREACTKDGVVEFDTKLFGTMAFKARHLSNEILKDEHYKVWFAVVGIQNWIIKNDDSGNYQILRLSRNNMKQLKNFVDTFSSYLKAENGTDLFETCLNCLDIILTVVLQEVLHAKRSRHDSVEYVRSASPNTERRPSVCLGSRNARFRGSSEEDTSKSSLGMPVNGYGSDSSSDSEGIEFGT